MLPADLMTSASPVLGCSVCYGAADSPLTAGLNMGILSMLAILVFVLALFARFFLAFRKRAKELV